MFMFGFIMNLCGSVLSPLFAHYIFQSDLMHIKVLYTAPHTQETQKIEYNKTTRHWRFGIPFWVCELVNKLTRSECKKAPLTGWEIQVIQHNLQ
jgi:hypothetical protein